MYVYLLSNILFIIPERVITNEMERTQSTILTSGQVALLCIVSF